MRVLITASMRLTMMDWGPRSRTSNELSRSAACVGVIDRGHSLRWALPGSQCAFRGRSCAHLNRAAHRRAMVFVRLLFVPQVAEARALSLGDRTKQDQFFVFLDRPCRASPACEGRAWPTSALIQAAFVLEAIISFLPFSYAVSGTTGTGLACGGDSFVVLYLYAHYIKLLDMRTAHGVCLLRGRGGAEEGRKSGTQEGNPDCDACGCSDGHGGCVDQMRREKRDKACS